MTRTRGNPRSGKTQRRFPRVSLSRLQGTACCRAHRFLKTHAHCAPGKAGLQKRGHLQEHRRRVDAAAHPRARRVLGGASRRLSRGLPFSQRTYMPRAHGPPRDRATAARGRQCAARRRTVGAQGSSMKCPPRKKKMGQPRTCQPQAAKKKGGPTNLPTTRLDLLGRKHPDAAPRLRLAQARMT